MKTGSGHAAMGDVSDDDYLPSPERPEPVLKGVCIEQGLGRMLVELVSAVDHHDIVLAGPISSLNLGA